MNRYIDILIYRYDIGHPYSECFELNTILTVALGINPNVIDESPSKLAENSIFFLCLKHVSVLQLIFYFKGNFFFFQLYYTLKPCT